jgi:hypothetical protein
VAFAEKAILKSPPLHYTPGHNFNAIVLFACMERSAAVGRRWQGVQ